MRGWTGLRGCAAALVPLVVMVSGCGSVGDAAPPASPADESSSTSTAPDTEPEETATSTAAAERDIEAEQAAIDAAMLTLSDFPDGWEQVAAADVSFGEENLAVEAFADCLGVDHDVVYPDGPTSYSRFVSVSDESVSSLGTVYASEDVAADIEALRSSPEAYECTVDQAEERLGEVIQASGEDVEIGETTIHPMLVTPLRDGTKAVRVTIPMEINGTRVEGYIDQIMVRVGRVVIQVQAQATLSPFDEAELERYTALVADRIAAAELAAS